MLVAILMALPTLLWAEDVSSPDGQTRVSFYVQDSLMTYEMWYKGRQVVMPSRLGIELDNWPSLMEGFEIEKVEHSTFDETWQPVWGEETHIRNRYNEMAVTVGQPALARRIVVRFRVYDEGMGLRYELPRHANLDNVKVREEHTQFRMAADHTAYWIPGDYDTDEYEYTISRLSEIGQLEEKARTANATQSAIPAPSTQTSLLMKTDDGLYISIHEAALVDYSCMHLRLVDELTSRQVDNSLANNLSTRQLVNSFTLANNSSTRQLVNSFALANNSSTRQLVNSFTLANNSSTRQLVNSFTLESVLTPDAKGLKGYLRCPAKTPWRTVMVTDDARRLLASRLILNLNEPCRISDTSWIHPVKYMGVWWEMMTGASTWNYGDYQPVVIGETDFTQIRKSARHGANNDNVKRYIDFASANGFSELLVEGWNEGWEDNWQKHINYSFTRAYPDFDLPMLQAYARERGMRLMMHHETSSSVQNYERQLKDAYQLAHDQGYDVVKSGYVGNVFPAGHHFDQWMVEHYQYCIREAAKYHLMVNGHEAVRPTGLCRTWPNMIGNESARGNEFMASEGCQPKHVCILPFTRLQGGPMDFTPGILEMDVSKVNPDNHAHVKATVCNQLALYVTMYSPLQMAADVPESYERYSDAFQFIKDVPVEWERAVYLEAEPAEYITIARQEKGSPRWFVGGVAGLHGHTATVDCSFLERGRRYEATIYADAPDADYLTNSQAYTITKKTVGSRSRLKIHAVEGGGFAISIRPLE